MPVDCKTNYLLATLSGLCFFFVKSKSNDILVFMSCGMWISFHHRWAEKSGLRPPALFPKFLGLPTLGHGATGQHVVLLHD